MKLLLIHHTAYHFEVLLAFAYNFSSDFEVRIWSNNIDQLERRTMLANLGLSLYDGACDYDVAIVLSGDAPESVLDLSDALTNTLKAAKVLNVIHQFHGVENRNCIYVYPTAPKAITMASVGMACDPSRLSGLVNATHYLVQGHVDPRRRAYGKLADMGLFTEKVVIDIVGGGMPEECVSGPNIRQHLRLNEISFHEICSRAHFMLPLIDPDLHPQYFEYAFTSTICIGFSYSLPFIAHEKLFDLYPIRGYKYKTYEEMFEILNNLTKIEPIDYVNLVEEVEAAKTDILEINRQNLRKCIEAYEA